MSKQVKKGQVEKKVKAEEEKKKVVVQDSSDDSDSSEDEKPVVATKKNQKVQEKAAEKVSKAKKQVSESSDSDDSDSDKPAPKKVVAAKTAPAAKKAVAKKESSDSDSDSEEEKPAPKKAVAAKTAPVAKKAVAKKESSDSDSESEEEKPAPKKAVVPAKKAVAKKESSDSDSESEEEKPAAKKAPVATKQAAKKQQSDSDEESSEEEKPAAKKAQKMEVEEESSEEQKPIKQDQPIQKANNGANNNKQGGDKFANEVIVKGLSFDADENDIGNHLDEKCGPVSRVNLLKNEQGRSKGIAFVSFETEEACNMAIELNNSDFMGRYLVIEKTKPKTDRPAHLPVDEDSKTIFVGNLSFRTDKETLKKFFASCGKVADARIAEADGKSRGFGHVEFEDRSGVENALKKVGEQIDGRPIKVDVAASRGKREGFNRSNGHQNNNRGGPRGGNNSFSNERKGAITQFQGKIQSL